MYARNSWCGHKITCSFNQSECLIAIWRCCHDLFHEINGGDYLFAYRFDPKFYKRIQMQHMVFPFIILMMVVKNKIGMNNALNIFFDVCFILIMLHSLFNLLFIKKNQSRARVCILEFFI